MERIPRPDEIYRHFKGNLYRVVTLARHTETEEMLVIYQALYGGFEVYARPLGQFMGKVDHARYPDAAGEYRFSLVQGAFGQEATVADTVPAEEKPSMTEVSTSVVEEQENAVENREPGTEWKKPTAEEPEPAEQSGEVAFPVGEPVPSTQDVPGLDPLLLEFLDADSYEEKLNILAAMHSRMTWEMLNTAAVSLDLELEKGEPEECYRTLKNCLLTLEKYECSRLR